MSQWLGNSVNKFEFRYHKNISIRLNVLGTTVCGRVHSAQRLETYLQGISLIYHNQHLTHLDGNCWNTDTNDGEESYENNNDVKDEIH
jgi:hypothetical protein